MLVPGSDGIPPISRTLISNPPTAETVTTAPIHNTGTTLDETKGKEPAVFLTTPPPQTTPLPTGSTGGLDDRDAQDLSKAMLE
ncbi:hypothetical protein ColLi_13126 [Colletotrichum liriopes]|uniref:Uncharacterized protein n=1 Tax=Colletotrichum liriopes TaxID=708192 RepID=A0AA37GZM5_9PEZI|nr:hypothetical protein ColLi_13126 [Colletotrichum liriopes]